MKHKVLHISSYLGSQQSHGGTRRSEQILEILQETSGIELITFSTATPWQEMLTKILFSCLLCFVKAVLGSLRHIFFRTLSIKGGVRYTVYGWPLIHLLRSEKPDLVILEIGKGASLVVAEIVIKEGLPYIAVPHNIEFLVAGQTDTSFCSSGAAFNWELTIYRGASQTLAISEFDATILRCLNLRVDVLPYYPTYHLLTNINIIRERREKSTKSFFLILGTVENAPTRIGTERLLAAMSKSKDWHHKVIVAGYGSEQLKSFENQHIEIRGSVSDYDLFNLLESAVGVIIQQPQTTGFMTRLTELNLSSVPVFLVGSYEQARHLDDFGIFLLESIHEILECPNTKERKLFKRPLFQLEIPSSSPTIKAENFVL